MIFCRCCMFSPYSGLCDVSVNSCQKVSARKFTPEKVCRETVLWRNIKKKSKMWSFFSFQNIEWPEVNINPGAHMHLPLKYRVQQAVKVMLVYTSGSSQSISRALSISEYRRTNSERNVEGASCGLLSTSQANYKNDTDISLIPVTTRHWQSNIIPNIFRVRSLGFIQTYCLLF